MRLYELIDTKTSTVKVDKLDKHDLPYADDYDIEDDTVGSYAKVDPDEDDPHMVKKTTHPEHAVAQSNDIADSYFHFIKYITDNKLADNNPFFPRVYSIKTNVDKRGMKQPVYQMEKLIPFSEIDQDLLIAYGNRIFLDFEDSLGRKRDDDERLKARGFTGSANLVGRAFSDAIFRNNIADKKLADAIGVIKKLIRQIDGSVMDLHAKNMMFRRSGQGIQLVLIDPIA